MQIRSYRVEDLELCRLLWAEMVQRHRDIYGDQTIGGDNPITDITLQSDNPKFQISPQSIDTLVSDTLTSFISMIRVSALHGIVLDGYGRIDLMPMNENSTMISINGNTIDENNQDITVGLEAELQVFARVMDVSISFGADTIDLTNPNGLASSCVESGGIGGVRTYWSYVDSYQQPKITNIGNVPITIIRHNIFAEECSKSQLGTINPGEDLFLELLSTENSYEGWFGLDGENTVTDYSRLVLGLDGKAYLFVLFFLN